MTPAELDSYLYAHIPLSRAVAVTTLAIDERELVLRAPLAPNINHRETVFGGSASVLAILSAWSLIHTRLAAMDVGARLVIQRNSMEYLQPIVGDFVARARFEEPDPWPQFMRTLARRARARIAVVAVLEEGGRVVGRFRGEFVAFAGSKAETVAIGSERL